MRGRKPKPAEVHERNGNPSHKAKDEMLPTTMAGKGRPERPRGLPAGARKVWDEVIELLEDAGVLDKADGLAVEALARTVHRAREASKAVDKDGLTVTLYDDDGQPTAVRANPAVKIESDQWGKARQLFEQLGIGPTARARLGIAAGGKGGKSPEREMEDLVGSGARKRRGGLHAVEGGRA